MSRKERDRLTIMTGVKRQELTLVQAGELMGVSTARASGSGDAIRTRATRAWCIGCAATQRAAQAAPTASAWRWRAMPRNVTPTSARR